MTLQLPYAAYCFNQGSIAFHLEQGAAVYLGNLATHDTVAGLRAAAQGDKVPRRYTHAGQFGAFDVFVMNTSVNKIAGGLSPPTSDGLEQVRDYLTPIMGQGVHVTLPDPAPATWATESRAYHIDICTRAPASIVSSTAKLYDATDSAITIGGDDRPLPPDWFPGVTLERRANLTRSIWAFDDRWAYLDNGCRLTDRANFARLARRPGMDTVQMSLWRDTQGHMLGPARIHLFARGTNDPQSCVNVTERAPPP